MLRSFCLDINRRVFSRMAKATNAINPQFQSKNRNTSSKETPAMMSILRTRAAWVTKRHAWSCAGQSSWSSPATDLRSSPLSRHRQFSKTKTFTSVSQASQLTNRLSRWTQRWPKPSSPTWLRPASVLQAAQGRHPASTSQACPSSIAAGSKACYKCYLSVSKTLSCWCPLQ